MLGTSCAFCSPLASFAQCFETASDSTRWRVVGLLMLGARQMWSARSMVETGHERAISSLM